jgi:hypothetical protein
MAVQASPQDVSEVLPTGLGDLALERPGAVFLRQAKYEA